MSLTPVREERRNRLTGAVIVLLDADATTEFDRDGGRWVTYCDTHHALCNHATLALARYHMAVPEWCEDCQDILRRDHPELFQ